MSKINWSAFRSGLLLGIGIASMLAAGAFYMQGCKATPEQNAANVATREAVNTANAQVQADPKATPEMKEAAKRAADVVNAGVTDSWGLGSAAASNTTLATTMMNFLPGSGESVKTVTASTTINTAGSTGTGFLAAVSAAHPGTPSRDV